jgi:hypothetical protein
MSFNNEFPKISFFSTRYDMLKKVFSYFLLFVFTHYVVGCSVYKEGKEFNTKNINNVGTKILKVVYPSGKVEVFDKNGGGVMVRPASLKGKNRAGVDQLIPIEMIKIIFGGTPPVSLELNKVISDSTILISKLILKNGSEVEFDSNSCKYVKSAYLIKGITVEDKYVEIPSEDALYVLLQKVDGVVSFLATIGVILGVLLAAFLIALATKQSCPFIYSFDGEKFVFDAEPLGGAITKGLERVEYSRLSSLKEIDSVYKLRITNEVIETEYIDEMSLFVVDHPLGSKVAVNNDGKVFCYTSSEKILYAKDEVGNDLKNFLIDNDDLAWQTYMPVKDKRKLKHKINFAFNKKPGAKKAYLLYNAGTTLWGSNMIREMLTLHGNKVEDHYAALDKKGEDYITTMKFLQREELYEMKLMMNVNGKFESQALLQGGGPFKTENRVIELDLSKISGDKVEFEVNPAVGFWSLDHFSLIYPEDLIVSSQEIKVSKAVNYDGKEVTGSISQSDEKYHIMPNTGDYFNAEYVAPPLKDGNERTVFMKTKGYYKINFENKQSDPDYVTLYKFLTKPGEVIRFSSERYQQWLITVSR